MSDKKETKQLHPAFQEWMTSPVMEKLEDELLRMDKVKIPEYLDKDLSMLIKQQCVLAENLRKSFGDRSINNDFVVMHFKLIKLLAFAGITGLKAKGVDVSDVLPPGYNNEQEHKLGANFYRFLQKKDL